MDIETRSKDIQAIEGEKSIGHRMENLKLDPTLEMSLIGKPEWTLAQLLGVKAYVTTIPVTNASSGILYNFVNNPANALALFPTPDISLYFGFIRYEIVFEFEVQSTFQHQGALVVNVYPNGCYNTQVQCMLGLGTSTFTAAGDIITSKTILPHDFITFGHNGNYKVVMPWTCNRNMLPTNLLTPDTNTGSNLNHYVMNVLDVIVYDQLQHVASAVGTTSIRVWARLQNVQYSGFKPNY